MGAEHKDWTSVTNGLSILGLGARWASGRAGAFGEVAALSLYQIPRRGRGEGRGGLRHSTNGLYTQYRTRCNMALRGGAAMPHVQTYVHVCRWPQAQSQPEDSSTICSGITAEISCQRYSINVASKNGRRSELQPVLRWPHSRLQRHASSKTATSAHFGYSCRSCAYG